MGGETWAAKTADRVGGERTLNELQQSFGFYKNLHDYKIILIVTHGTQRYFSFCSQFSFGVS